MGLFSAISGAFSAVCSLGGSLLGSLASGIGSALSLAGPIASIVIGLVKGIAEVLGIGKKEEKPEELGLKVAKADKKLEDFDSFDEYKSYLDKINLDKEDLRELDDPMKKRGYEALGVGVYIKGINEHYKMDIPIGTYIKMAELGIDSKEGFKKIIETYKEKNVSPDVEKAINSEVSLGQAKEIVGVLREGISKLENAENVLGRLDKMMEEI